MFDQNNDVQNSFRLHGGGGTSLGLMISRKIIAMHGGHMGCSQDGLFKVCAVWMWMLSAVLVMLICDAFDIIETIQQAE